MYFPWKNRCDDDNSVTPGVTAYLVRGIVPAAPFLHLSLSHTPGTLTTDPSAHKIIKHHNKGEWMVPSLSDICCVCYSRNPSQTYDMNITKNMEKWHTIKNNFKKNPNMSSGLSALLSDSSAR